jgi:hypothetical protein
MRCLILFFILFGVNVGYCQTTQNLRDVFTHDDTLRGSLNGNRTWWNVLRYDLEVEPDYVHKSIRGRNTIKYHGRGGKTMQIDLQEPMLIDSILFQNIHLSFERHHNVYLVPVPGPGSDKAARPDENYISIYFHGEPRNPARPPWDGGWLFTKDQKGRPWMTVTCQGWGASVWYPCKDYQGDEPD